ncbi:hypothetical protein [Streptomyces sp. NBC_00696]|uniref:Tetracyclin repressor-like C-terminal domain-containing protein n=1 Tax=Streptomyces sp. R08 TaxID=3238624 RepID=A0AB39MCF8_9ACTN|nr:hypothetical protein [Streptomyces sp. NBC_00696]
MRGGARVLLNRVLLGHTALNSPDTEPLIPYLHAALDAVANAPAEAADTDRPSDDTAAN